MSHKLINLGQEFIANHSWHWFLKASVSCSAVCVCPVGQLSKVCRIKDEEKKVVCHCNRTTNDSSDTFVLFVSGNNLAASGDLRLY